MTKRRRHAPSILPEFRNLVIIFVLQVLLSPTWSWSFSQPFIGNKKSLSSSSIYLSSARVSPSHLTKKSRQRFITGSYPLLVSMLSNPKRKYLKHDLTDTQVLINGTSIENSLASIDQLSWLEPKDEPSLSIELVGEITTKHPAYLRIMKSFGKEKLMVTDFSMTKALGGVTSVDCRDGKMKHCGSFCWPNEVGEVAGEKDALLVTDGFLVPGRDFGGVYVIRRAGEPDETKICLSDLVGENEGWFYHRASWVDLTGDGRLSILTARAKRPPILNSKEGSDTQTENNHHGQLVWLERPKPCRYDETTGTPLDFDGTVFDPFRPTNTPWKCRILDYGPDVMFSVADLDPNDNTIEVIASEFFGKRLSLHSITISPTPHVSFRRTLDSTCGKAYSCILANLDQTLHHSTTVIDSGSTIPTLLQGTSFSHVLVTSHESDPDGDHFSRSAEMIRTSGPIDGGSLFAYSPPQNWRTDPWERSLVATGFHVKKNIWNMINPGAPGFCYTFHANEKDKFSNKRPLVAISGDCAETAYVLRPVRGGGLTDYALLCEIDCGATVGSLAVGYDNCFGEGWHPGGNYAKIYIPCYEKSKVLVFALGGTED